MRVSSTRSAGQQLFGPLVDLGDAEGLAAHPVVADRVDEVARPEEHQELAEVDLGDEHLVEALEDLAEVARERVQVAQVGVGDALALGKQAFAGAADGAVGGAPAEDQQLALLLPKTTRSGMSFAMRATFSARSSCIRWWLSGS